MRQTLAECTHDNRKKKALGLCGSCYNKNLLLSKPKEIQAAVLASRSKNKKSSYDRRNKETYSKAQRNRMLKHRYGISSDEYDSMPVEQGGKCKICRAVGGETKADRLYVDHSYTTGQVRGLLCATCNTDLGTIEKGEHRINELRDYLRDGPSA